MDYESFCKILTGELSELPINRKERFYTGTVLPAVLFHNGLNNFYCFLRAIKGFPHDEVNEETIGDNFLFYTEYNLNQSAGYRNVGRKIPTSTNDTPDVIIEILRPKRVFVIIEAKMFENASQSSLSRQMSLQKKAVIEPLRKTFQLDENQIFHVALVPGELRLKNGDGYQIINWEHFIKQELDLSSNYFYKYLKFAIANYSELVAIGPPPPPYPKMSGQQIYEDGKNNVLYWVGRQGGEKIIIEEDIDSDEWETSEYYVNQDKPSSGRRGNWITSIKFAELVDKYGKG
ncbi:MAG: hypothetical protein ABSG22_05490 [Sedimentisphaerales bacterium]|jgi:hypothetical protein